MTTIVRVWSGPRNLSTAMMRSWDSRSDTAVLDEPFYARYLATTGLNHPAARETISAGPVEYEAAVQLCTNPPLGAGQSVSYQKQMAHHLVPGDDRGWIPDAANMILLRHPRRVLASYTRVRAQPTLEDLGFPQLVELQERFGPLPVFESDRFLANPEQHLRAMCEYAGITFDSAMLSWKPGPRSTDGVWAPHWYGSVHGSTRFAPAPSDDPDQIHLPEPLEPIAHRAAELYDLLLP